MKAILFVSHGSRSPRSRQENFELLERIQKKSGIPLGEAAFLETDTPSIPEGIERCVSRGVREIIVLLNFLNSGRHVLEDIPALVEAAKKKHPDIVFRVTPPVGTHPAITDLFLSWI